MATNNFFDFLDLRKATGTCVLVAFFYANAPVNAEVAKRVRPPTEEIDLSTQYWVEAFDFFQSEGDSPSLEALRTKAVEKKHTNIVIIKKVLDSLVSERDRALLLETMISLVQKNACTHSESAASSRKVLCEQLEKIWIGNLDSIYFFEETAGKMERARRHLLAKECDKALPLLKEVGQKEGALISLSDLFQKTYACLGDDGNRVAKEAELQKLRIFDN